MNTKASKQKHVIQILVVLVIVTALVVSGIAVWLFVFKDQGTPREKVAGKEPAHTSYSFGAVVAHEHNVPNSGAVLASQASGDIVYSLVIVNSEGEAKAHVMETKHGEDKSAIKATLAKPLKEVLTNPYAALCSEVNGLKCRPAAFKEKPTALPKADEEVTVELQKSGTFTWNSDDGQWKKGNTTFDSNLILGEVDDLVIGTQQCGEHAGRTDTAMIPVTQITAYEADSGTPTWSKELDSAGYVSIANNRITVTETPADQDDNTALFGIDLDDKEALDKANALIEAAQESRVFELAPAEKGKADSTKPLDEKEEAAKPIQPDAIRSFDFENTQWTLEVFDGTERPVTLANGEYTSPYDGQIDNSFAEYSTTFKGISTAHPTIQYFDFNGDGYEDALVPLLWSSVPFGGLGVSEQYHAWLWDPQTQTAVQLRPRAFSVGTSSGIIDSVTIGNDGVVTVQITGWPDGVKRTERYAYDSSSNQFVAR
ncbi:MAG: hypothetical protein Q4P66_08860 [Actinomycetaceae bacterium]|nr:hypothetical protein [Actinomycetaceae bacterium]